MNSTASGLIYVATIGALLCGHPTFAAENVTEEIRQSMHGLKMSSISAPIPQTSRHAFDLQRAIHTLTGLEPVDPESRTTFDQPMQPEQPTELTDTEQQHEPVRIQIDHEIIKALKTGSATGLANAQEIADSLYGDGEYSAALELYELAYEQPGDDDSRAWILFQMGNCLQHSSPAKAREHYARVVKEYPDCRWSQAANQMDLLLEWQEVNKPLSMIKSATAKLGRREE